ncbi:competence protein CoiA [Sporosarcina sp. G11-34]|uniref:competence protein CoiA n=1 Tax=Sporosarcina sp. G11-34 TaxID=2849605 RepID=UPI003FA7C98B
MKRKELKEWRLSSNFYCPQCGKQVQLKVGDIVIPHFAHKSDASCSASFSEGESKEHLEGKIQLFKFFQKTADQVVLEPYFKSLSQRPDLLITIDSQQIPVEFQCSTIAVHKVKARTNGYLSADMKPIWIMRTPAQSNTSPQGVGIYQFSKFQVSFFTYNSPEGTIFLTYNPQTKQFHYYSSLIHLAGNRYIGIHRTLPISMQTFPFARPKIPSQVELEQYTSLYLSSRMNFLKSRVLLNRKGINDPFLRSCYELRTLPIDLPIWIGLPVPFSDSFSVHACEWQLRLIHFMRQRGITFSSLSRNLIQDFISEEGGKLNDCLEACFAYRDYFISIGVESPQRNMDFSEKKIVQLFAERFLAKTKEH